MSVLPNPQPCFSSPPLLTCRKPVLRFPECSTACILQQRIEPTISILLWYPNLQRISSFFSPLKCPGHVSFNRRKVKIKRKGQFLTFPFPFSNPSGETVFSFLGTPGTNEWHFLFTTNYIPSKIFSYMAILLFFS